MSEKSVTSLLEKLGGIYSALVSYALLHHEYAHMRDNERKYSKSDAISFENLPRSLSLELVPFSETIPCCFWQR